MATSKGLIGQLFSFGKKTYVGQATCNNCGEVQEVAIPKGLTVEDFFQSEAGKCTSCGCACLRKVGSKALALAEEKRKRLQDETNDNDLRINRRRNSDEQ